MGGGAYGGFNRTSGDATVGSNDLTARAGGFAVGADYRVSPVTTLGFALAGGFTNWSLAAGLGGGRSDALQAGAYGVTRDGPAYLAAALAYGGHWLTTDRFASAGGVTDHLTAGFTAHSLGARLETGWRLGSPSAGVTPYAAAQAQNVWLPAYAETSAAGGPFALSFNARNATATRGELGARIDRAIALDDALLILRARAAWAHDWTSDPSLQATFQSLPGASFVVAGAAPARDAALLSAGSELRLVNRVALIGRFESELAARSATYSGTGTLRYAW